MWDTEILQVVRLIPRGLAVVPWIVECGILTLSSATLHYLFALFCPVRITQAV